MVVMPVRGIPPLRKISQPLRKIFAVRLKVEPFLLPSIFEGLHFSIFIHLAIWPEIFILVESQSTQD